MKIQIQKTLQGSEIVSAILWCLHASSQCFKENANRVFIVSSSEGVRVIIESESFLGFPSECVVYLKKALTIFGIKACESSQIKCEGNQAACLLINQ